MQEFVLNLRVLGSIRDSDTGQRNGHVKNRALIQRRHELRTQTLVNRNGDQHDRDGRDHDKPTQLQRDANDGMVESHQWPADRMILLTVDCSYEYSVGDPREPLRPEPK